MQFLNVESVLAPDTFDQLEVRLVPPGGSCELRSWKFREGTEEKAVDNEHTHVHDTAGKT